MQLSAQQQSQERKIVRVLTFNILHGATTKGDFNLDVLSDVINKANPDFVALQEVDFKTKRARNLDLTTELAQRTGMTSYYARAMDYDGGAYGEGVLSKRPILAARNVALPHQPNSEPRAAAEITVVITSGDTIRFIGTHLDHLKDSKDRMMQVEEINKKLVDIPYPAILVGDLNDIPESKPITILESKWGAAYKDTKLEYTFPSDAPRAKIDYVMYTPKNRWKVLEAETICDEIASDHCAYLVVLELVQ
jgi:endonuclease/exonuclease/phosphatase family metal-dependent hydrolase